MSCRKNFRSDFHALFRFTDLQSEAFLGKHTAEQHFQSLEEKSNFFNPWNLRWQIAIIVVFAIAGKPDDNKNLPATFFQQI